MLYCISNANFYAAFSFTKRAAKVNDLAINLDLHSYGVLEL